MNQQEMAGGVRWQAEWCHKLDSPLYHSLLLAIASDIEASGACWQFLEAFADEPPRSLFPLRFLAMFHRMALDGRLPELARSLPSCGGTADAAGAFNAIVGALNNGAVEQGAMPLGVQTNEVSRSCALLPGFLAVARDTRLPLRLLEVGCSAGLNLRWDAYRYVTGSVSWGMYDSPIVFRDVLTEAPRRPETVSIVERKGCDLNPVESDDEGRLSLLSFVWPDQTERLARLSSAIEIAREYPARLDRADAAEWIAAELSEPAPGAATVVFQSVVLPYLSEETRAQFESALEEAGKHATRDAPLAWVSMEGGKVQAEVWLTQWPGGRRGKVAECDYHARRVVVMEDYV